MLMERLTQERIGNYFLIYVVWRLGFKYNKNAYTEDVMEAVVLGEELSL